MRAPARNVPGRVELWPVVIPQVEDEPDAWVLPVDAPEQQSPPVVVAGRIADLVRSWTTTGDETGRVWKAGDVLVLVRKRGAAFEAMIRALKEKGVPVAGADRLNIGEHIAVMDLVAAGRAALLPDDDLTLATALKSPLVGLTDDDLIRIAAYRGDDESLLCALERHAADDDARGVPGLRGLAALARIGAASGLLSGSMPSCLAPWAGEPNWWRAWGAKRVMPSTRFCPPRTNRRSSTRPRW